jgi:hypothetical protein
VTGDEWRVTGGGWRVTGGGWRVTGDATILFVLEIIWKTEDEDEDEDEEDGHSDVRCSCL